MLTLLLARHGETAWNRAGRYQGCLDTPLSALGRRQARALAEALDAWRLDAVYTSPQRRALETAVPIATRRGCPLGVDPALREICHGDWEGLTVAEVEARFPALLRRWRTRPAGVRMPRGESLEEVAARVLPALDAIARRHPRGTVCVVTHGVPARLILARARGRPLGALWEHDSPPAAISELLRARGRAAVRRLNLVGHLPAPPRAHLAR
jgi:probable phosphoglycerate mutase